MKKIIALMLVLSFANIVIGQQIPIKKVYRKKNRMAENVIYPTPAINIPANQFKNITETENGITYNLFYNTSTVPEYRKGIVVMGSGNDDANPNIGNMNDPQSIDLCKMAAQNGYVAAVIQYTKGKPSYVGNNWNENATQMAVDFDKCITAISGKYGIDKSKSVVGGYSYTTFMLLTNNAYGNELSYCKGQLAACGATDAPKALVLKYPIYAITCAGKNEGDYAGIDLYNLMASGSVKSKSGGFTDNTCTTHCGGNYTQKLYQKLVEWLQ